MRPIWFASSTFLARPKRNHCSPSAMSSVPSLRHGGVADDGPRHQLGEEHHIEGHVEEAPLHRRVPPVDVDDVAHGLEGIEADADGQQDGELRHRREQGVQIRRHEAQVLEDEEQSQVAGYRPHQGRLPPPPPRRRQQAEDIVHGDRHQNQRQQPPAPAAIEPQAEEQQHGVAPLPVPPGHQEIDRQQRRQKEKQEGKAAEYHGRRPAFQQNCPGKPRPALLRRNV